ncbi:MAG: hypothetical protein VX403_10995 [Planctomycetota bacterium]|nr:hypothetical protein [Planctomycetota bacterium]
MEPFLTQALSQTTMFYIFMGIMVLLSLVSGIFVYHSIIYHHGYIDNVDN